MNAFVILIPAGIVVVLAAKYFQRWRMFGRRPAKALITTYEEENLQKVVEFAQFREVMELISRSYSVPIEKLRLTDTFTTDLGAGDSFSLDHGNECAARHLTEKFPGISLEKIRTIRDVFVAIAEESKKHA